MNAIIANNAGRPRLAARSRAGCFPVLFLLAFWLALVTPLRANNPPTFLFQIDASAVPGGWQPLDLALDTSNNLYVADMFHNRVVKLAANGSYLTQWGGYGTNSGQFSNPAGIAVDRSNTVYVADQNDHRVEKFDSSGNYLAQWGSYGTNNGQFNGPSGVAVDSSNNVYVVDTGNSRVEKFDRNGTYLTQWGGLGSGLGLSGNGQFVDPAGIAVDRSNNVYVADTIDRRVEKFDSNGNYLTQWGSSGTGNGQFSDGPLTVAVDSSNNVYVTDYAYPRVEKFTSNGNYLTQWGSHGAFNNLAGVAVDSTGNFIYVADPGNDWIKVFVNNANIVPPIITNQPVSQTVPAGTSVNFSVGVLGTAPLAYQWTSNNVAVPGAIKAAFTLTNVSLSASGAYFVLGTNNYGSVLSSDAVLTVLPALVTTQPASGLSATGAVLNGSVTVGPRETVAWFEWGTDTSYGNIAGATIVPGNNGYNYISATLIGLSGNFYHYRLDAANDFGIVYGDDQSFTVGFAPTATTLDAVNSTNGSTLNAVVNPDGWDTTVYFHWVTPTLTNSTPGMDIGAGLTSLNVSSFVPGLAPFTPYQYRVMASNALGTVLGEVVSWAPPFVSVSGEAGVVFTSLHSFSRDDGAGPNGLVQASDGNFYGTTYSGGTGGGGTVFKISANGVLASLCAFFNGSEDGYFPSAGLVQGTDGYLYGTTEYGGYAVDFGYGTDYGTIFAISTNGTLINLYFFQGADDGWGPKAGLVQGSDGYFYGTTYIGPGGFSFVSGPQILGYGNVFQLNGSLTGIYSPRDLYPFGGPYGVESSHASEEPNGLVQGSDGYLYGTTEFSGAHTNLNGVGQGTVFQLSINGAFTNLYSFTGANDGAYPQAALAQGRDGSFYGTTSGGGTNGAGTVFKINTNGALTSLYSFTGANDGANPEAALVQGRDGYLYGTTVNGGSSGNGTVFAVNTNGTGFTTLYSFSAGGANSSGVITNSDGANPQAGLIFSGTTLWGTTSAGGIWGDGTVFSLTLPAPAQLSITHSGTNVILTWPANAAGFTLEFSTNLVSPVVWNTNSTAPVVSGGQNVVTNPIIGTQQFYRLSSP